MREMRNSRWMGGERLFGAWERLVGAPRHAPGGRRDVISDEELSEKFANSIRQRHERADLAVVTRIWPEGVILRDNCSSTRRALIHTHVFQAFRLKAKALGV